MKIVALLVTATLAFAAAAPAAETPARIYRIGYVQYTPRNESSENLLKLELKRLGYEEGVNVEYRYMDGKRELDDTKRKAIELLQWKPDVIVTTASAAGIVAQEVTRDSQTPVVFWATDAASEGMVKSNAHPGGNLTGFSFEPYNQFLQVRFLKLAIPDLKCIAHLYNPTYAPAPGVLKQLQVAGRMMNTPVKVYQTLKKEEFEGALAAMQKDGCKGVVIGPHELFNTNGALLGPMLLKYGLASAGVQVSVVRAGGLVTYSPPPAKLYYPAFAQTIDRILKGEKPAGIPMQRNYKSTVLLNVRAAQSLGLDLSPELIDEADEVIR